MNRLAFAIAVVCLSSLIARGAGEPAAYDWRSKDYSGGETVVGCGIAVTATKARSYVAMELAVKARPDAAGQYETELRVTSARRETGDLLRETPLTISGAWLRSSGGTTIGVLRPLSASPSSEYVATARGFQPFADLFRGIRRDGATLGMRLSPSGAEEIESPGPPPGAVSDRVIACVNRLLERR